MNIIETNWNWRTSLTDRPSTKYIALHHAAAVTCSAATVHSWHRDGKGWSGIGYHFFIRKNGEIYRGRPLHKMGAHVEGMNNCSIGICAEGDYDVEKVMPEAQKDAIKALLRNLKEIYPAAKIVGHREIGASDCPGTHYPLEEMKNNYNESEGIDMEDLKQLQAEVDKLKQRIYELEHPMIYNYIDENMPQWAHEGVQWCVDNGIIEGTGDGLGLDDKDLKYCTIMMRLGKGQKLS